MDALSYKHHLELLESKPGTPFYQKIAVLLVAGLFVSVGILSALFYNYLKDLPQKAQYQYLENANSNFSSSAQSLNEILSMFKVAGEKVGIVDTLKDSANSPSGFFVTLDDMEKILSQIETTKQNIDAKRADVRIGNPPAKLTDLNNQIIAFYSDSSSILSGLHKDQLFAKDLLLASGPKFYLPVLSNDELWEKGKKEDILAYYENAKNDASASLGSLSRLSPPPHFEEYYKSQIAYLTLLVNLSDNIINTLSVSDDQDKDTATQIEKAYQLLVGAKRENEIIAQKLLGEKLKLVDVGENLNKLAPIEIRKNSIDENLKLAFSETPKPKPANIYLEAVFEKLSAHF